MKKKRSALTGSALGFLAVLIGEAYCLLNFRGDYIMAAGVGVVLLIMTYLMLDAAFDYWDGLQETGDIPADWGYVQTGDGAREDAEGRQLQKGMYVVQRRGFEQLEAELERTRTELSDLMKAEMQYERENTRALISHNKKETELLTQNLQELQEKIEKLSGILEKSGQR